MLQKESKTYSGDDYTARVSGYEPSLDFIEVYPKTTIIKENVVRSIEKRNSLSLGVEVGYVNIPYIPIYLEYSRMLHKNVGVCAKVIYDIPSRSFGIGAGARVQIGW
jgi:hypothetical protein